MANLKLTLICSDNDRTRPIIDGQIRPDGIDLSITVAHPSEMFWRQLSTSEFDISEMSMSSFLIITAQDDMRFVGLPIFTSRRFFHGWARSHGPWH
jgi:4,5-dihydroxyphthalate decarboxylase